MNHSSRPAPELYSSRRTWLERTRAEIRRRWGRLADKWMWGQVVAVWSLTQALPVDVLDQLRLLRTLCDPMVSAIPSASSYIARSAFPQVAELILCLGWILAAVNFCFGVLLPEHMHKGRPMKIVGNLADIKPEEKGWSAFFAAGLVMVIVIPTLLWTFLTVPVFDARYVDNDMALWSFTQRLTFGFVAQAVSSLFGFAAAAWFVVVGHFIGFFVSFWSR